jgi:hypothetical protein
MVNKKKQMVAASSWSHVENYELNLPTIRWFQILPLPWEVIIQDLLVSEPAISGACHLEIPLLRLLSGTCGSFSEC